MLEVHIGTEPQPSRRQFSSPLLEVACFPGISNPSRGTVDLSPLSCRTKLFDGFASLAKDGQSLTPERLTAVAALYSIERATINLLSECENEHIAMLANHLRSRYGDQADAVFQAAQDLVFPPDCIGAALTPFLCRATGLPPCPMASPFRDHVFPLAQTVAESLALVAFWVLPANAELIRSRTSHLHETALCIAGGDARNEVMQRAPHCRLLAE